MGPSRAESSRASQRATRTKCPSMRSVDFLTEGAAKRQVLECPCQKRDAGEDEDGAKKTGKCHGNREGARESEEPDDQDR